MSERLCARGCDRDALHGFLICDRCASKVNRALTEAPGVVEHLRSLNTPLKAAVYDREIVSGGGPGFAQAPMDLGPIDAADTIVSSLVHWARHFGDTQDYWGLAAGLPSYTSLGHAYRMTKRAAGYLIAHGETIAASIEVLDFMDALFAPPGDTWTIGKAASVYPTRDRPHRHRQPCPGCQRRSIEVAPPGDFHQETKYRCRWETCGWTPPYDELVRWRSYFHGTTTSKEK
ncbi:hypothetical protein D9V32_13560 [Mycetocola tolaasinivorans]|uniref:Uncharacterized protein n=1 Tax=Mycetocola tolaasinivorans TaxID=76635 RepID=A0A3L7A2X4_9MICO|nr:hypothetical protein [Mycetocola tolaasinivorans]RLP74370.1 hypothetical protein D9V32_13560 [Mycetocola tolaasinivorans]